MYRMNRGRPLIIDPGLYQSKKSDIFWMTQKRELPTAFKLFTGDHYIYEFRNKRNGDWNSQLASHDNCYLHVFSVSFFYNAHRLCLDGSIARICGVLCVGLGQSTQDSPNVLHQLRLLLWGLLPDGYLQHPQVCTHGREPRPPFHRMGLAAAAASPHPQTSRPT